jgi:hypothetical protein
MCVKRLFVEIVTRDAVEWRVNILLTMLYYGALTSNITVSA